MAQTRRQPGASSRHESVANEGEGEGEGEYEGEYDDEGVEDGARCVDDDLEAADADAHADDTAIAAAAAAEDEAGTMVRGSLFDRALIAQLGELPIPFDTPVARGLVALAAPDWQGAPATVSMYRAVLLDPSEVAPPPATVPLPHERLLPTRPPPVLTLAAHVAAAERIVIVLCHGGYFAAAAFARDRVAMRTSFHAYVTRRKQGGRQSTRDKGGRAVAFSAGSHLRRTQERKLAKRVTDTLSSAPWSAAIAAATRLFVLAPGPANAGLLHAKTAPLIDKRDPRLRSVPFACARPSAKEIDRVFARVTGVRLVEKPVLVTERADATDAAATQRQATSVRAHAVTSVADCSTGPAPARAGERDRTQAGRRAKRRRASDPFDPTDDWQLVAVLEADEARARAAEDARNKAERERAERKRNRAAERAAAAALATRAGSPVPPSGTMPVASTPALATIISAAPAPVAPVTPAATTAPAPAVSTEPAPAARSADATACVVPGANPTSERSSKILIAVAVATLVMGAVGVAVGVVRRTRR